MEKIAKNLRISDAERMHLALLIDLSFCHTDSEKIKKIQLNAKKSVQRAITIVADDMSYFFRNRMCSIICLLIDIYKEDFSSDLLWITRRVRLKTSLIDVSKALSFLVSRGFIVRVGNAYENRNPNLASGDERLDVSIKEAHKLLLEEAGQALSMDLKLREFASITAVIPEAKIPALKERIKKVREDLHLWILNTKEKNSQNIGVSVNIQMYPITTD